MAMRVFAVAGLCAALSLPAVAASGSGSAKKAKRAGSGSAPAHTVNSAADYSWVHNGAPLRGGLKTHRVGQYSKRPVTVYRLWDSQGAANNRARQWGAYWASTRYTSEAAARRALAVCWEFNHMDKLTTCTLQPNAITAYGPGQNVRCADRSTLGGGPQQIVIANAETLKNAGALTNCRTTSTGWTGAGFRPGSGSGSGSAKAKAKKSKKAKGSP